MEKVYAGLGIIIICLAAWLTGRNRNIKSAQLLKAFIWLWLTAFLIFMFPPVNYVLGLFNKIFIAFVDSASLGNRFVFGALADGSGPTGFILAFQALTLVIFFSSISALFYKLRIIPIIVRLLGSFFKRTLGISGVEGLGSAGSLFVGIEVGLFLKSYLKNISRSELFLLITLMMSTVASTVMGVYTFFLKDQFPNIAGHLLGASLVTIPASVLICKLMMPDENEVNDDGEIKMEELYADQSVIESFLTGTQDGVKLAVGITATLIAVIGLKGVLDSFLLSVINFGISDILNIVFKPFAYILGINPEAREAASMMLALRFTDTEVSAYLKLAETLSKTPELFNSSSKIAITYALCGFSHLPSFGIFAGGLSAIMPERRKDFVNLSLLALWSSFLTTLLTGCIAKIFA